MIPSRADLRRAFLVTSIFYVVALLIVYRRECRGAFAQEPEHEDTHPRDS